MGGYRGRCPASFAARLLFLLTLVSLSVVPVLLAAELRACGAALLPTAAAVVYHPSAPGRGAVAAKAVAAGKWQTGSALLLVASGGGGADPLAEPGAVADVPLATDPALPVANNDLPLAGTPDIGIFGLLVKVVLTLGFICAIIYGMFWFIAKKGRARSGRYGLMRLVETMPLGQNRFVGIVEVAQRYFVVGIGDHSVNPIAELDAPEIAGLAKQDDAVAPPAFLNFLNDKVRQLKRKRP